MTNDYHYSFSSDIRINDLARSMNYYSKMYILNYVSESKSDDNVKNTYGYYFNFKKLGFSARLAASGKYKKVLLNFVKKFQYPNPRSKQNNLSQESCIEPYNDGIYMAPLRSILKLLYIIYLSDGKNGYLTQSEITDFVFYNSDVAKNRNPDYLKVYKDLKDYRVTGNYPPTVEVDLKKRLWKGMGKYYKQMSDYRKYLKDLRGYTSGVTLTKPVETKNPITNYEERQIGILLYIMKEAGCITQNSSRFCFSLSEKSGDIKKCILDIMTYDEFWEYDQTKGVKELDEEYFEYMEIDESEEWKMEQQIGKANKLVPRNRIIFGAPGTGKSFTLNEEIKDVLPCNEDGKPDDTLFERVTFYPSYTYSQFVGAYKPKPKTVDEPIGNDASKTYKKEIISYEFVPGPFTRILVKALDEAKNENPKNCLLIIEEINRANAAAVFGDVFQLLDRKADGSSMYAIETTEEMRVYLAKELKEKPKDYAKITIPSNLYIWSTMNSADQGVTPLDTAFKRRWDFEYIKIDAGEFAKGYLNKLFLIKGLKTTWNLVRKEVNRLLQNSSINLSEDKLLGPFFLSETVFCEIDVEDSDKQIESTIFNDAFKSKVLMYLFGDVVKSKRSLLFNSVSYAQLCDDFDEIGIRVIKGIDIRKIEFVDENDVAALRDGDSKSNDVN